MVGVGAVDDRSAVLWLRAKEAGVHAAELWPDRQRGALRTVRFSVSDDRCADGTGSVRCPGLEPGTRYGYRLVRERGAAVLGEGSFETAPASIDAAADELAIAFGSCHQPFGDDGEPTSQAIDMLAVLERAFRERGVRRVLLLGDQMYADYPRRFSLFDQRYFRRVAPPGREHLLDCTRDEVRALYQARYRSFWTLEGFQRLQAHYPCYMIPDDHELVDNFGSAPEHSSERWRALHDGALDACYDYQCRRVHARDERPASLHFRLDYGPFAAFVMDLRSERVTDERRVRIYGDHQLHDLAAFLTENAGRPVIAIGLSVPLVHVPKWLANAVVGVRGEGTDAADRWDYQKARGSRDALVSLLARHRRAHPEQQLLLLGGDIHTAAVSSIEIGGAPPAIQAVSSALTNIEDHLRRKVAELVTRLQHDTVIGEGPVACRARLLAGERGSKNPYAGLNVGVLRFSRVERRRFRLALEMISCDARHPGQPLVVYRRELPLARFGGR